MSKNSILAIVVPCFNEGDNIFRSEKILRPILDKLIIEKKISDESFVLFVDDGSNDQTWNHIVSLNRPFHGLKMSKNVGHQNALLAGLEYVFDKSDCSISIDADCQQDPGKIPEFINLYSEGAQIVYGVRQDRNSDSVFKKLTGSLFYAFAKLLSVDLIANHSDYRLMSKKALGALIQSKDSSLFLRGTVKQLGFESKIVIHEVFEREIGKSKYSVKKMLHLALNGILNNSIAPLRFISFIGLLVFSLSFIMIFYILYITYIGENVPGWASTVIPIYFIGGVQLLSLGIIGEYIAKVFNQTKQKPLYFIDKEIWKN